MVVAMLLPWLMLRKPRPGEQLSGHRPGIFCSCCCSVRAGCLWDLESNARGWAGIGVLGRRSRAAEEARRGAPGIAVLLCAFSLHFSTDWAC